MLEQHNGIVDQNGTLPNCSNGGWKGNKMTGLTLIFTMYLEYLQFTVSKIETNSLSDHLNMFYVNNLT